MKRSSRAISMLFAVAGLATMGAANAVPCGSYGSYGGIKVGANDLGASAASCQNGTGSNDSTGAMNAGDGYFGIDTWTQLNRVPDSATNTSLWSFSPGINDKMKSGQFTLASDIWNLYSDLAVVLKDGGSTADKNIKWSAYLLPENVLGTYDWSYDNRKEISHISLYGVLKTVTVTVPEPATAAIFLLGLGGMTLVLRRRVAAAKVND